MLHSNQVARWPTCILTLAIRSTTLSEMHDHAERSDGLALNALDLPGGHFIHPSPLLGTGFDVENVAYCKTNGLPGFSKKYPPYEEMYWKLLGLARAFSYFHFDISATWVYVSGPGEKFWIRSRPRTTDDVNVNVSSRDISDSTAFENWQPDRASLESCDYELQQPGREHAVIISNTGGDDGSDINRRATWTYASGDVHNNERPWEELEALAAYCPDLDGARGWMDIVYLSCVISLFPALDLRNYGGEAAQTDGAKLRNKKKNPHKLSMMHQAAFGLFLWSTGSARQTIDAAFRCGLTSIFVEQRSGAGPAKVTSGTFGILYGLRNAKWDDMLIAPIMKRFRACTGLDFNRDIRPSLDAFSSLHDQLIIVAIHCLGKYNEEFSDMFVSLLT
ncbi:hypothetical protein B0H14DRAFT_2586304 [Mycena olivaceomarginata]|nr:hypothetical protein B0H14DRAFT_2586304 [Mycena olivaceomarginata]